MGPAEEFLTKLKPRRVLCGRFVGWGLRRGEYPDHSLAGSTLTTSAGTSAPAVAVLGIGSCAQEI
jgi:hypothetical protein